MPIVDGLTSTKMIRSFEKTHAGSKLSLRASINGRVPIFAVSASLVERERQTYIDAGFDGWILKPIDFKRLTTLLSGIVNEGARKDCLYQQGEWERGGWFQPRQPSVFQAETRPSNQRPVHPQKERLLSDASSHNSSESGSMTPTGNEKQLAGDYMNEPQSPYNFDEAPNVVRDIGPSSGLSLAKDRPFEDVTE